MRFPQVEIGQRFSFQGRRYTKTGPLTASEEGTGSQRMIQRSAEVALLDAPAEPARSLRRGHRRAELERAVASYRRTLERRFRQAVDGDGKLRLETALDLLDTVEWDG
jgi:hypothetical protein